MSRAALAGVVLFAVAGGLACSSEREVRVQHGGAAPEPTAVPATTALAATAPGRWVVEDGVRVAESSAPATLRLPDGSFRMYLPGLNVLSSQDGVTWGPPVRIALSEPDEKLRNPAVVALGSGKFLMIYEGVRDERGPARSTRFYRAVSTDGLAWDKTAGTGTKGAVMEPTAGDRDFLSAPDILLTPDGSLLLYFNTSNGERVETARSTDEGRSWTRGGPVTIDGFAKDRKAADPDVIAVPAGGYRMFFGAGAIGAPNPRILSATSLDGQNFTLDSGERLEGAAASFHHVDPDVVEFAPGRYRMYFAETSGAGGPYGLRSAVLTAP